MRALTSKVLKLYQPNEHALVKIDKILRTNFERKIKKLCNSTKKQGMSLEKIVSIANFDLACYNIMVKEYLGGIYGFKTINETL